MRLLSSEETFIINSARLMIIGTFLLDTGDHLSSVLRCDECDDGSFLRIDKSIKMIVTDQNAHFPTESYEITSWEYRCSRKHGKTIPMVENAINSLSPRMFSSLGSITPKNVGFAITVTKDMAYACLSSMVRRVRNDDGTFRYVDQKTYKKMIDANIIPQSKPRLLEKPGVFTFRRGTFNGKLPYKRNGSK